MVFQVCFDNLIDINERWPISLGKALFFQWSRASAKFRNRTVYKMFAVKKAGTKLVELAGTLSILVANILRAHFVSELSTIRFSSRPYMYMFKMVAFNPFGYVFFFALLCSLSLFNYSRTRFLPFFFVHYLRSKPIPELIIYTLLLLPHKLMRMP